MYIFPTVLRPIFKLFLKSRNLNDLIISPKIHSTDVLTVLMDLLYAIMSGVSTAPLKGDCRCTLKGYAGSPYRHSGTPVGEKAYCSSWSSRFESASIPASCRFPSIEKKGMLIQSLVLGVGESSVVQSRVMCCLQHHFHQNTITKILKLTYWTKYVGDQPIWQRNKWEL